MRAAVNVLNTGPYIDNLPSQALLLDPVVNSIPAAEKMLDDMLELQRAFLPTFE